MENLPIEIEIRLALQKSLVCNISKNVRGICCNWDDNYKWFNLVYYLEIIPNNEEIELQSVVLTEFESYVQRFEKINSECIFSMEDFSVLNKHRVVIFWRNELEVFGRQA